MLKSKSAGCTLNSDCVTLRSSIFRRVQSVNVGEFTIKRYASLCLHLMRPRYYRRMTYTKLDVVKICVLIAVFCFLLYSALIKFAFVPPSGGILQVEANLGPCDVIRNCADCTDPAANANLCEKEVKHIYAKANQKCKGYLVNFSSCKSAQRGPCRTETNNVEGCFSSVTGETIQKWVDISKKN